LVNVGSASCSILCHTVFFAWAIILIVLYVRWLYFAHKFAVYLIEHYPRKAKEDFGISRYYLCCNPFRAERALTKKDDTSDPRFVRLKSKAKSAYRWVFGCVLFGAATVVALVVLLIIRSK